MKLHTFNLNKINRNIHYIGIGNTKNNKGGKIELSKKVKIIIADDNKPLCDVIKAYLKRYEDIEILGIANTDEDEIKMIEELKPEIVITDFMRNHKYTGLEIIKHYFNKKNLPQFLVISAGLKEDVIRDGIEVAGYIQKNIMLEYEVIVNELKRIKTELNNSECI